MARIEIQPEDTIIVIIQGERREYAGSNLSEIIQAHQQSIANFIDIDGGLYYLPEVRKALKLHRHARDILRTRD